METLAPPSPHNSPLWVTPLAMKLPDPESPPPQKTSTPTSSPTTYQRKRCSKSTHPTPSSSLATKRKEPPTVTPTSEPPSKNPKAIAQKSMASSASIATQQVKSTSLGKKKSSLATKQVKLKLPWPFVGETHKVNFKRLYDREVTTTKYISEVVLKSTMLFDTIFAY